MKAQDETTAIQNPITPASKIPQIEPTSPAMAQNGPHGHQDAAAAAECHSIAPPKTTVVTAVTSLTMSTGGSSSAAGNMETKNASGGMGNKNNLIPDLNKEERGDDSAGGSKDIKPRSQAEVIAAADDAGKGKMSEAAVADDGQLNVNLILERERRKKMKDLYRTLHGLMPHVPAKTHKVALVGEAIQYIKALEEKEAMLRRQKQKQEQELLGLGLRGEASSSSSSFSLTPIIPQTAQGMAALWTSSDVAHGGVPAAPVPPGGPASPLRFKTWSGPNVVLTVANRSAYISVCAPRRTNTLTTVFSVLDHHGIDVITAQISSDNARSRYMIFAHVTGTDGHNASSEQVYQMAASEIMLRINNTTNSSSINNINN